MPSGLWAGKYMADRQHTFRCRVNSGGVIPVIFAASIVSIPSTLGAVMPNTFMKSLASTSWLRECRCTTFYTLSESFFSVSFMSASFSTRWKSRITFANTADTFPGSGPGHKTAEYIDRILSRLTAAGAVYLVLVCLLPEFLITGFKVQPIPLIGPRLDDLLNSAGLSWITTGLGVTFYFGGTSLLIVVGVAMDTIQQIESQLIMRHYDGFLKKGRIRGRRG